MSGRLGPVEIPGLTVERLLGSGASAEVYLYRQELPRRQVAVKVMREPVNDDQTRMIFETEANLMAAVSTHPSIVTIHHAAIAGSGRPYLVMEYCSQPSLAEQVRARQLTVPEVLQTMIRLAGAVETAHRAGILHRDLKPANVLTTDYGWPALADFGISAIAGHPTGTGGSMSLPWAAPEVIAGHPYQPTADVYALAATAYTLLAGASPFVRDGANDVPALMARILSAPPPRIDRADVPEPLQRLLQVTLAKDPAQRPQSASELARGLQRIEQDMHLPATHLDVPAGDRADADADAEPTQVASICTGSPSAIPDAVAQPDDRTAIVRPGTEFDDRTALSSRGSDLDDRTALASRGPDLDDRTALASRGTNLDDRTALASRGSDLDDRTRLADRHAPDLDDRTALAGGRGAPPEDRTVLRGRATTPRDATTDAAIPTSPQGRVAYDPGATGTPRLAYGVRAQTPAPAPHRLPPQAPTPPLPSAPPRSAASSRRRARTRLILIAAGLVVVLAAAAATVVVLLVT